MPKPLAAQESLESARTRYGHAILVNPADYIGRQILKHGAYDRQTLDLTLAVLRRMQARTILDVGANIGNHTLAYASLGCRVVAFEPGGAAFSLLQRNISLNNLPNVTALNIGLSRSDGRDILYVDGAGNLGASSLVAGNAADARPEEIELRLGDAVMTELGIEDVDFIKVDVEGHEHPVLEGLAATIAHCRPLVQMEWDANSSDRSWLTEAGAFEPLFPGYDIYALIWNSNVAYWSNRPWGRLRRLAVRLCSAKRRVLTRFDPVAHSERVNDVLMVPREKTDILGDLYYR